jgi:tRNA 2-selenouridine synthase
MRSRSLFTVMHLIGYQASLLAGGYQTYRRAVQSALYEAPLRAHPIVIHGFTGSGKTSALLRLKEQFPVVDLEGCANHRGSLLGKMPGGQPTQKDFESRIYQQLPVEGDFLVEGESRKIGRLSVPPSLWNAMESGCTSGWMCL